MNQFFRRIFQSKTDSVCSKLNISNLTDKARNYIEEMVGTVEALLGKGKVHSVILFGSLSHGKPEKMSDVDLLILTDNSVTKKNISDIEAILNSIEIKHKYGILSQHWVMKIMSTIEKTTGMFKSHFISTIKNWEKADFSAIFTTNRYMTYFLAPEEIVLDSMKAGATKIYGNASIAVKRKKYSAFQLFKSLLMDMSIAVGTFAILPLNRISMKYSLESFKWSMKSCFFYLFNRTFSVSKLSKYFEKLRFSPKFLRDFMSLRENLQYDWKFVFRNIYYVFKIHSFTYNIAQKKKI
jgi:predicted nucleotidyltransferase